MVPNISCNLHLGIAVFFMWASSLCPRNDAIIDGIVPVEAGGMPDPRRRDADLQFPWRGVEGKAGALP